VKPPRAFASRDFWFAVCLAAVALVSVWFFVRGRATTNELRQVVATQQRDLEKICNTTTTLDIGLVVPLLSETNHALEDLPPSAYRQRIIRLRNNLATAHAALSETQSCEPVR
jgi:hypothetical protein